MKNDIKLTPRGLGLNYEIESFFSNRFTDGHWYVERCQRPSVGMQIDKKGIHP